jgi:DUF4097 and DUF4098 domain-containing protein YvlB
VLALVACDYDLGPDVAVISEPFSYELDAAGHSELRLFGVNGAVTVTGGRAGGSVSVVGARTVQGCSRAEADAWIDDLEVRVDGSGDAIVVRTVQPRHTGGCSLVVEYDLHVPARFAAEIGNVNGAIRVRGLRGGTYVANVNGKVDLHGLTAPVRVGLTNGNIDGDAVITGDESVDLTTVNGNVELAVPTGSSAVLTTSLTNGIIRVTNLALSSLVSTRTTLTGVLGAGDGEIRLRTTNGNITATGS